MLRKGKKNDAKAVFEILVRENQPMLLTYLRAVVRDKTAVDDLFQDTMLIAWKKLGEYDHSRPFGPWLRGIAARLVMAHFRKAKSGPLPLEEHTLEYFSQQIQHINSKPGDTWDDKIIALQQCIEILSEQHQQVIKLRYFEEHPTSRIAVVTKTSLETIRKRLQRARSHLLDCLKRKKVVMEISR